MTIHCSEKINVILAEKLGTSTSKIIQGVSTSKFIPRVSASNGDDNGGKFVGCAFVGSIFVGSAFIRGVFLLQAHSLVVQSFEAMSLGFFPTPIKQQSTKNQTSRAFQENSPIVQMTTCASFFDHAKLTPTVH